MQKQYPSYTGLGYFSTKPLIKIIMKKTKTIISAAVILMSCLTGVNMVNGCPASMPAPVAQSSASPLWNGDIPSAEIIYSFFYKGSTRYEQPLKAHGYVLTDNVTSKQAVKPGFCQMDFKFKDAGAELEIRLDDTTGQEWLVENIKNYISTALDKDYTVTLTDGVIHFDWTLDI